MKLDFENNKYIMGILNVTPDSFYDGGKFFAFENAVAKAKELWENGADIIDVGGESTRPGSESVSLQDELDRVCPVVEKIKKELDVIVSIDTTKSIVAEECLKLGADIINDISGLTFDDEMVSTCKKYNCYVSIMHTSAKPAEMQKKTSYVSLINEIIEKLSLSIKKALDAGINSNKIIVDPGIGFGKTLEDNYRIINNIKQFKELGFPVLIGLSRKSLIGNLYNNKPVDRLPGTIALNAVALYNGCDIIRVHDLVEHKLMLDVIKQLFRVH